MVDGGAAFRRLASIRCDFASLAQRSLASLVEAWSRSRMAGLLACVVDKTGSAEVEEFSAVIIQSDTWRGTYQPSLRLTADATISTGNDR